MIALATRERFIRCPHGARRRVGSRRRRQTANYDRLLARYYEEQARNRRLAEENRDLRRRLSPLDRVVISPN